MTVTKGQTPLLRQVLGSVLRNLRQMQKRTLREVSAQAQVSLGYLSEVERGQKEASSELLISISQALDVPLAVIMRQVALQLAVSEGILATEQHRVTAEVSTAV